MEKETQTSEEKKQNERIYATKRMYRDVFLKGSGNKILIDLMRKFFLFHKTVAQTSHGPIDVNATLVHEGMRNVILYILDQCNMSERQAAELIQAINREVYDEYE